MTAALMSEPTLHWPLYSASSSTSTVQSFRQRKPATRRRTSCSRLLIDDLLTGRRDDPRQRAHAGQHALIALEPAIGHEPLECIGADLGMAQTSLTPMAEQVAV